MLRVLNHTEQSDLEIHLPPEMEMTEDQFWEFCALNRDLQIERTAQGEILIMAPEGGEAGHQSIEISLQLANWAKLDGTGAVFGSSGGFVLPNGATRSPDASWVLRPRLAGLSREQKKRFLPLCPDFVIELRSPSDRLSSVQKKMAEYLENGARLGWLIDPQERKVYLYRPERAVEQLDNPGTISGDPVLKGFVLDLRPIWEPGL